MEMDYWENEWIIWIFLLNFHIKQNGSYIPQYRVAVVEDTTFCWLWFGLFLSLPKSGLAGENWAEIARQMGKLAEIPNESQQNLVSDHDGHPVSIR